MKKYLVVGGTSGITKSIVKLLTEKGDYCFAISRIEPDFQFNGIHFLADVLTGELPVVDQIDGIVYGVGSITLKPFNRLSIEDFQKDMELNLFGAVRILQHYLPTLKNAENGSIVLFSSVASQRGMPFHASIASAKAAVEGFAKSLAAELAPKIRVNVIAPSIVDTPLASGILRNDTIRETMIAKHPLKRILNPEDVAKTAVFLLSDESMGITGQILIQDNGLISLEI